MAAPSTEPVKTSDLKLTEPDQTPDEDTQSDTSEEVSTKNNYGDYQYGYRSSNCSEDEDDEDYDDDDPYQELFMNAYRSAPVSSEDEDDEADCTNIGTNIPEAKPLSLMEDWDLWDYMDESELKQRLKDHPKLLEEITRKRKRKILDEEEAGESNEELNDMMNRFVKYIRRDPTNVTS